MSFFSGLGFGGDYSGGNLFGPPPIDVLPAEIGAYGGMRGGGKKGRGGLFGSGVTSAEIAQALGALASLGAQQQAEPYHFQPLPVPHTDLSGLNGGAFQRPVPPMNLANYFNPFGFGGGY